MYNQKKYLYVILFYFLFSIVVYSNEKPLIINLLKEDYQAENKNWSISQDELGTIYFGNDGGLLEFDGIEWKLNKLPYSKIARSVGVLSHQTIFTGGYEDFGRWDRDISGDLVYTSLYDSIKTDKLKNNDFWKIWVSENIVYFQSFNSVYAYDYKETKLISPPSTYLFLSKVRDEYLIQDMQGPLYRIQGSQFIKIENSEFLSGTDVRVILPYSTDAYLIGTTSKGLYIYDGHSFREWNASLSSYMNQKDLNCGILTSKGTYLLGTILDGIYEVDTTGAILNHLSSLNGLQNNTILNLYEDYLQNIWVALDKGIAYIQHAENLSYYIDPNGSVGAVYDAVVWNDKLFIGTNQGVFYLEKEQLSQYDIFSHIKLINGTQGQVWSFEIIDDQLICCHNRGLKEIHADLRVSDIYRDRGVYSLIESKIHGKNVLLLSTYVGLSMIDKETQMVTHMHEIPEPIIKSEVDHLENIWLEHANRGVYRCKLCENMNSYCDSTYFGGTSKDTLPYKMQIFKVGGRIVLLGDDHFYTYDDINNSVVPSQCLNECFRNIHDLKKVIPIHKNLFWALSKNSIYKFTYDGYQASILERYSLGMNLSFVNSYENISVLNDSISLVCLDNGFFICSKPNKEYFATVRKLSIPYLESFSATNNKGDTKYIDFTRKVEVSYSYNTITFYFSTKNAFASNLSFQYKLANVDFDWSSPHKVNNVTYARLLPGEYTFMVRSKDSMGNFSDPVEIKFRILSPWYWSFWALILYVFIFFILLYVIWILILRRYRNLHLQKIRARETKRLRALADELQNKVEQKNAELLTQTSFIIQKNELILKIKALVEDFYTKYKSQAIAPLYQKISALLNNNLDTEDDWKTFLFSFEQKHAGFFKKIKSQYPDLTNSDLRLCACLKLNLETKDIASLMNLSIRAVENNRYRLRKKLNLNPTQKLYDFFLGID